MKLFIARLFAVILIAVSIIDACAWSGPGHMTVAAIAYRDLSPVERQKLDTILESHPQFQSWRDAFPEKRTKPRSRALRSNGGQPMAGPDSQS